MHIETLKVFCDLVDCGSFSQAAARNLITQSAVSQQVKSLEQRFDRRLLTKQGRRVATTEGGQMLYDASREILARFEGLSLALKSLGQDIAGSVRLASIYSVGLYEVSMATKLFLKTYPTVNLRVEYSQAARVYEDCLKGAVDLGIVPYPRPCKGLEIIPLPADRLILICSPEHAFAHRRHVDIHMLHGQDFVAFDRGTPSRSAIDKILEGHEIEVRVVMEFDNIETMKRSVEIGAGISIVPLLSVQREVQAGTLVQIHFTRQHFFRPLGIIVRNRNALNPAAQRFIEMLQQPGTSTSLARFPGSRGRPSCPPELHE
jgi:LysR family transcriptional regulator, transcriptional activator of the cysJI operon